MSELTRDEPDPALLADQRRYDRVIALGESLVDTRRELDETASQIRVALLSLERAKRSRAWRFGHGVTMSLRTLLPGRSHGGADAFDAAIAKLAALEGQDARADGPS